MKQTLLPKKVIKTKSITNAKALKRKIDFQVVLCGKNDWINMLAVANGGYLVLDFGKEMNGGIRIITGVCEKNNISIRVRFGESLSEVYSNIGEKGATNDHSPRDFTATISSCGDIRLGETGFRFVRIDFLDKEKVVIQNVFCENNILNKKLIYNYSGKDRKITDIFIAAKRTIDLCAAGSYIVDGVKRDRLVWIGDLHPEMLSLVTLYGKMDKIEKSLEFVRKYTPDGGWMNGISSYSAWWIIIVADYYFLTKSKEFASNQLDYVEYLINQFDSNIDNDGNLNLGWLFVDWQTTASNDSEAGVRAICIIAAKKAKELLKEFGRDVTKIEKLLTKLKSKPLVVTQMKQVIALKYWAEEKISDNDYNNLIKNGAEGLSTFMSYYVLKAIADRDKALAVSIMKEYYGAMLNLGATTFFEDFDINWAKNCSRIDKLPNEEEKDFHGDNGAHCYEGFRHSLCHGWASGVIKFIKEYC